MQKVINEKNESHGLYSKQVADLKEFYKNEVRELKDVQGQNKLVKLKQQETNENKESKRTMEIAIWKLKRKLKYAEKCLSDLNIKFSKEKDELRNSLEKEKVEHQEMPHKLICQTKMISEEEFQLQISNEKRRYEEQLSRLCQEISSLKFEKKLLEKRLLQEEVHKRDIISEVELEFRKRLQSEHINLEMVVNEFTKESHNRRDDDYEVNEYHSHKPMTLQLHLEKATAKEASNVFAEMITRKTAQSTSQSTNGTAVSRV